ncbi:MAG: hypothetical protein CM1200mP14_28700 [Gammaproteobacteria bacterium]|nr:MAG: hypothetical protein CM1200mP14_28700 [Gammaproteobacteria bacterium]
MTPNPSHHREKDRPTEELTEVEEEETPPSAPTRHLMKLMSLERVLMLGLREFAVTIRPTTTISFGRSLTVFGGGVVGTGRLPSSS